MCFHLLSSRKQERLLDSLWELVGLKFFIISWMFWVILFVKLWCLCSSMDSWLASWNNAVSLWFRRVLNASKYFYMWHGKMWCERLYDFMVHLGITFSSKHFFFFFFFFFRNTLLFLWECYNYIPSTLLTCFQIEKLRKESLSWSLWRWNKAQTKYKSE